MNRCLFVKEMLIWGTYVCFLFCCYHVRMLVSDARFNFLSVTSELLSWIHSVMFPLSNLSKSEIYLASVFCPFLPSLLQVFFHLEREREIPFSQLSPPDLLTSINFLIHSFSWFPHPSWISFLLSFLSLLLPSALLSFLRSWPPSVPRSWHRYSIPSFIPDFSLLYFLLDII